MVRELRARIGAARLLLAGLQGTDALQAASSAQRVAFLATLKGQALSPQERADLMALVGEVVWAGEDGAEIIKALAPPAEPVPHKRMPMQTFTSITDFFTESEWKVLQNESTSLLGKREVLIGRAIKLSCRCPSEHTMKWFASLLLVCGATEDIITSTCSRGKLDMMKALKVEFKQMCRRLPDSCTTLVSLPGTPQLLATEHPELFAAAYSGESPVACPLDIRKITSVNVSFRCRSGAASEAPANLPPSPPPLQLLSAGGSNLNSFVSGLMSSFHQMQQTQERMMSMMMMGSGGGARPLRSLTALADVAGGGSDIRLTHASAREQSLPGLVVQPPLAAQHLQVPVQGPPSGLQRLPTPVQNTAALSEGPLAIPVTQVPVKKEVAVFEGTLVTAAQSAETIDDDKKNEEEKADYERSLKLLDVLEQRDAEKKKAKQEAAKAAKEAAKAAKEAAKKASQDAITEAAKQEAALQIVAQLPPKKVAAKAVSGKAAASKACVKAGSKAGAKAAAGKAAASKVVAKAPPPAKAVSTKAVPEKVPATPPKVACTTTPPQKRKESSTPIDYKKVVKATWGRETSRSQIMGRTGEGGPGSSKKFKYGASQEFGNEKQAITAAQRWVDELNLATKLA